MVIFRNSKQWYANTRYKFADKAYAAARDKNNEVPKILHFLWVVKLIPPKYLNAISGFEKNNPDYEVRVKIKLANHLTSKHTKVMINPSSLLILT